MQTEIRRQNGWMSFFVGLALGLFVAVLVYLQGGGRQSGAPLSDSSAMKAKPMDAVPAVAPPSPVPAEATKPPRFDFYTILPESETRISDGEPAPDLSLRKKGVSAPTRPPAKAEVSTSEAKPKAGPGEEGSYALQVGSFQHLDEADRTKAKLALLGVSAGITPVVVNGNETWYRVIVGPFADVGRLQAARNRLTENQIRFMVVKARTKAASG